MTYCFSCGQYTCRIEGSKQLVKLVPTSWDKFRKSSNFSSQTISIHLEEEKPGSDTAEYDGWLVQERQSLNRAIYFQQGKAIFGLQYTEPFNVTVCVRKALDSFISIGIHYGLMLALHQTCIGMHGVTILCGNEIMILSAPSGTGKTTLGKLLEKYCDAIIINGDFAMLNPTDDGVIFEPTPFCGTSGRSLNHRFRVNRVVFLGQAKENSWRDLSGREAMTHFMSNAFIPTWDNNLQRTVQESILKCISMLKVNEYEFAPTQEAAEEFLKQAEGYSSLHTK